VRAPEIPWDGLSKRYPTELVQAVRRLFERGGPFETSGLELSSETSCSPEVGEDLLRAISPPLLARNAVRCASCRFEIPDDARDQRYCPNGHDITDPESLRQGWMFAFDAARTRDVRWVLALHGMNTSGAWQEEFNWRVATTYGRSVPVAIYKYGIVRPGALSRWYLGRLTRDVSSRIERLQGQTDADGFGGPPDVIAHSLGTWLIANALLRNSGLRVGRLILTGSILRPDFCWQALISNGQVQAVLNHYGTKDIWAGLAHFVIPDSGPSGRIGFTVDAPIVQVRAAGFAHSDFFLEENLSRVFQETWHPFLTSAESDLRALSIHEAVKWSESPWPLRATLLPALLMSIWWFVVLVGILCFGVGIYRIFQMLMN
jgi:pimeloyl-ACP methyl ester carboxylesterase